MSEPESEQPWASLAAYRFQSSASVSAGVIQNTHSFTATPARLVFQRSSERHTGPRAKQASVFSLAVLVSPCRIHNPCRHRHSLPIGNQRKIRAGRGKISGRSWGAVRHRARC